MSYTPPAGSAVDLVFQGVYVPPTASGVELNLDSGAIVGVLLSVEVYLDDATLDCGVVAHPPATLAITLDNAVLAATAIAHPPADLAITLDDVVLAATAIAHPPADLAVTLDDAVLAATVVMMPPLAVDVQMDDAVLAVDMYFNEGISIAVQLDDCVVDIEAYWDAAVFRGLDRRVGCGYSTSPALGSELVIDLQVGKLKQQSPSCNWQSATGVDEAWRSPWSIIGQVDKSLADGWRLADGLGRQWQSAAVAPPVKAMSTGDGWQSAEAVTKATQSRFIKPPRRALSRGFSYGQGDTVTLAIASGFGEATPVFRRVSIIPWQLANPYSWIWGGWHYPQVPPPPPYRASTELVFYQSAEAYIGGAILEFNRPCWAWPLFRSQTVIRPGVTILLHTIKVVRLPDLVNVPVLSVSLQFDSESWAWGVALSMQTSAVAALVEPVDGEPWQVRIELDGVTVTALIEEVGEPRRAFGETLYTATGRSALALLAEPYAPLRSYTELNDRTAAQLIDHELTDTGWTAAYHADLLQLFTTDWLVPGGVWSYLDKSPVDVIATIAKAAGARAYADRNAALVMIAPDYPVSVWDWSAATVDKTISLSLVRSLSKRVTTRPDYNQVYVSGQAQGVLVSATRQGSGGDRPAPMVTDQLITYVNAGRERARNVLSCAGRQALITLDLPLNDSIGLLEPGQLVEVSESTPWRGLVRGISVDATHGSIAQQVQIERHYP